MAKKSTDDVETGTEAENAAIGQRADEAISAEFETVVAELLEEEKSGDIGVQRNAARLLKILRMLHIGG